VSTKLMPASPRSRGGAKRTFPISDADLDLGPQMREEQSVGGKAD
jgi:hypothetical protein